MSSVFVRAEKPLTGLVLLKEEPIDSVLGKWLSWMLILIIFLMSAIYFSNYFAKTTECLTNEKPKTYTKNTDVEKWAASDSYNNPKYLHGANGKKEEFINPNSVRSDYGSDTKIANQSFANNYNVHIADQHEAQKREALTAKPEPYKEGGEDYQDDVEDSEDVEDSDDVEDYLYDAWEDDKYQDILCPRITYGLNSGCMGNIAGSNRGGYRPSTNGPYISADQHTLII